MHEETRTLPFDESLQDRGTFLLRVGIGLVFVWFGLPKLVPGLSPAEGLVAATVTCCDPSWFVPLLGLVETLIGLCLWSRRLLPLGLFLMAGHMCGTILPLFTLPDVTWKAFPVATLEGQYIIKNVVLIAGAMVVAGRESTRIAEWLPGRVWKRRRRAPRSLAGCRVRARTSDRRDLHETRRFDGTRSCRSLAS